MGCLLTTALVSRLESADLTSSGTISVEDLVRQAVIGDPRSLSWNEGSTRLSERSPNGAYVALVVRHGNFETNTNDAQLLVGPTTDLLENGSLKVVVENASGSNQQPIANLRWSSDSSTLYFEGAIAHLPAQVYKVTLQDGAVSQLTHDIGELGWYDITSSGRFLVTAREPKRTPPSENTQCLARGCLVTASTFDGALRGTTETSYPLTQYDLQTGHPRTIQPPETTDTELTECRDELQGGISPDGRFGLRICKYRRHRFPAWWADYTVYPGLRDLLREGDNGYLRQLVLVDFEHGTNERFMEAPYFMGHLADSAPLWIDAGAHLLLAGALESLATTTGPERDLRASHYSVISVDPKSRSISRIATLDPKVSRVVGLAWDEASQTATVRSIDSSRDSLPAVAFRRTAGGWLETPVRVSSSHTNKPTDDVQLVLSESLNDPPKLFAESKATGRRREILDPNPWLAQRRLARVQEITWKSRGGRLWGGGLYYPPDFVRGRAYPLVIQTHGFVANKFSLTGLVRNFVAQPLAAQGMLVLQIAENHDVLPGPQEWPEIQDGYEAAIDNLAEARLIDKGKIGIIGWSRTGPYIGYTLTHSSYSFAAAAFTDTADFGWWWFMLQGARHGNTEYGTLPFGPGLDVWRKESPTFNLDRVHTPMLMWAGAVEGLWDWYVGLRALGKPVEYWTLPDATHELVQVDQRLMTNQLLVDWFRFWLKDEEDSDPAKKAQYARWIKMR
jgi:dipeptidyl aminopeptidase/acylaminoacyl peptidase